MLCGRRSFQKVEVPFLCGRGLGDGNKGKGAGDCLLSVCLLEACCLRVKVLRGLLWPSIFFEYQPWNSTPRGQDFHLQSNPPPPRRLTLCRPQEVMASANDSCVIC